MRIQIAFGALTVLAALAAPANAAGDIADELRLPAPEARILGARLQVCNTCHGDNGAPKNATIPIIWGQQDSYLQKELHDFRSGDRANEVMAWMAKTVEQADVGNAAAVFAKRNWPARTAGAAATPPNGVAVCQACHQQNFLGVAQAEGKPTPRLAGQSYEYLAEAMRRFAEGERTNDSDMVQIMEALSPAQREAMARYISSL